MKKPISNFYTVIWVEVPDAPAETRQRGTRAPGDAAMALLRGAKARIARAWPGQRLTGALAGATAMLAMVLTGR